MSRSFEKYEVRLSSSLCELASMQRRYGSLQFMDHRVQELLPNGLDMPLLADSQYLIDQAENKEYREQYSH